MYIGHYGISLALKRYNKNLSLGWLFIGTQLVDIIFYVLVLLGIEKMTIIENYTASTHFRLDYIPYTHGLLSTFIWGTLSYLFVYIISSKNKVSALLIASVVTSHWGLDLLVHTKDLPLWNNESVKFGFGLWNNSILTFLLEAFILLVGLLIYLKSTKPLNKFGTYGMFLFSIILIAINTINIFGPLTDDNIVIFSLISLLLYILFAIVSFWLDKKRI